MDKETKREIIMEHYTHPKNRKRMNEKEYRKINTNNASCIDNIDMYIKFNNNVIEDITFDGEACAISISATSIMIKNLIGKTKEEALNYINNFYNMVNELEYDEDILEEGIVYSDIYKQGNRKTCATLPFRGLENYLTNLKKD